MGKEATSDNGSCAAFQLGSDLRGQVLKILRRTNLRTNFQESTTNDWANRPQSSTKILLLIIL